MAAREAIRAETPADEAEIRGILRSAFGSDAEVILVDALRTDDDLACALIAERDGRPVGYIAFQTLLVDPDPGCTVWSLAPVAVTPVHQRQGLGAALIEAGLDVARARGVGFVTVLGDPAYYRRFGFRADQVRDLRVPWSGPHYMGLPLIPGAQPAGHARYPRAFET